MKHKFTEEQRTRAAKHFVELVARYRAGIRNCTAMPERDVQIILAVLMVACFDIKGIVFTQLPLTDEKGRVVNGNSPVVVKGKGKGKKFDILATGWLDCMLRYTVSAVAQHIGNVGAVMEEVAMRLESSVPMEPIQLPENMGYLLEPRPLLNDSPGSEYLVRHTRDGDDVNRKNAGIHGPNCGKVFRFERTHKVNTLSCACRKKIVCPRWAVTYADLREGFLNGFVTETSEHKKQGGRPKALKRV